MKNTLLFTFFVSIILGFFSCSSVREVDLYYEEMMEIHHQDMVVWGEIPGLKKQLKTMLESVELSAGQEMEDSLKTEKNPATP